MTHRSRSAVLLLALATASCVAEGPERAAPDLETAAATAADPAAERLDYLDIAALQELMERGELTAAELVERHLDRIAAIDRDGPRLRSVLEVNPDASTIAAALDEERRSRGSRGPLHGIPVLLKGNIDTGDAMETTAGSLALAGHRAADDAFHVEALRAAGAVILGKTNLSEWANFRSTESSSGWSSLGDQVRNPHVLDRTPCGSSSGSAVAVAAGLAVVAVGTETDGSIVCPAGVNGIVGIKPTVGLVSRDGIIPIAHTQDTAGPMARTVRDAAILLAAMAARDEDDPAAAEHPGPRDYEAALDAGALAGARIGVWRGYPGAASHPRVAALLDQLVETLRAAGATVVDPVEIEVPDEAGDAEYEVLLYEFKADLESYLRTAGVDERLDTLAELIDFNRRRAAEVMPWFGQEVFEAAAEKGPLTDEAYLAAFETSTLAMRRALDAALDRPASDGPASEGRANEGPASRAQPLDAIVAPTNGPAWPIDWVSGDRFSLGSSQPAATSGYPSISLPMGDIHGLPIGVSIVGRPWSEPRLIGYAYALESRLAARREPAFVETLEVSVPPD